MILDSMAERTGTNVRLVIVGSGPHALAVAAHIVELDPGAVRGELLIVDPSGTWLEHWRRRMTAFGVPHLRSPVVHHPAPDPYALQDFARSAARSNELHGRYRLPSVALFDDFCDSVIDRYGLAGCVVPSTATGIGPDGTVRLDGGQTISAEHVVLTHGARRPTVPPWTVDSPAVHADDVDLTAVDENSRVVIVGGGITAAHLAIAAYARGASVHLVCRRPIVEREFDSDPGWLGPKYMRGFRSMTDATKRAEAVRHARGGGSVPSWLARQLDALSTRPGSRLHRVVGDIVGWDGTAVHLATGASIQADAVWCATGWCTDAASDDLLGPLLLQADGVAVDGFVCLDHLQRIPSTPVHVTGPPASLALGPSAGNLSGARRSARAVAAGVFGCERADVLGSS
jgi:hypothetical protein